MVTRVPARRPWNARRRRQQGYNLVILTVMFTVMSIMVAKALPSWSTIIERDKEEELIFRGLQYAEAIRVFKQRFNRYPTRLEELIEVEPRSIRQLWNNPLAPEAAGKPPQAIGWGLIQQGRPANPQRGGRGQAGRGNDQNLGELANPATQNRARPPQQRRDRSAGDDGEQSIGPIVGVTSKFGEEAFHTFCGSDSIQQWRFQASALELGASSGNGAGDPNPNPVIVNASVIGRPWPPGVVPQRNVGGCGGAPGGQQPGQLQPARPGQGAAPPAQGQTPQQRSPGRSSSR